MHFELNLLTKDGLTEFNYGDNGEPDSAVYHNLFAQRKRVSV